MEMELLQLVRRLRVGGSGRGRDGTEVEGAMWALQLPTVSVTALQTCAINF